MPNWCYTQICFKGKEEDIQRLHNDIQKCLQFDKRNPWHCNLYYFYALNGIECTSYANKSDGYNGMFRGYFYDSYIEDGDNSTHLYATLDTAWSIDYEIIFLICKMYNVEFSAYSEEPNMDIFMTCHNTKRPYYDYDTLIRPDYDQFDEAIEKEPNFDLDWYRAGNRNDTWLQDYIDELKFRNIEYSIESIYEANYDDFPIQGVYYSTLPEGVTYGEIVGVTYDKE